MVWSHVYDPFGSPLLSTLVAMLPLVLLPPRVRAAECASAGNMRAPAAGPRSLQGGVPARLLATWSATRGLLAARHHHLAEALLHRDDGHASRAAAGARPRAAAAGWASVSLFLRVTRFVAVSGGVGVVYSRSVCVCVSV